MKRTLVIVSWLQTMTLLLAAQQADKQVTDRTIKKGNDLYLQQQYQQAETIYSQALEKDPANGTAKFNRGDALFKQNKVDESVKAFDDLAFKSEESDMKSKAYYNKGVALSSQKRLEESIEAYKNALRQNPDDKDARENLQKALVELKKKNPPKKENKKKEQQKQKQPQPKMSQKEAEQRLKLLEQKEKEVQERLQKEKSKQGGGQQKDW